MNGLFRLPMGTSQDWYLGVPRYVMSFCLLVCVLIKFPLSVPYAFVEFSQDVHAQFDLDLRV